MSRSHGFHLRSLAAYACKTDDFVLDHVIVGGRRRKVRDLMPDGWKCDSETKLDARSILEWYDELAPEDEMLPFFPGVNNAIARGVFGVELDGEARDLYYEERILETSNADAYDVVDPCALFDVRPFALVADGKPIDSVFLYPAYDLASDCPLIGVLGFSSGEGGDFAVGCISVVGDTYADMREETNRVTATARIRLALGGLTDLEMQMPSVLDPAFSSSDLVSAALRLLAACSKAGSYRKRRDGRLDIRTYETSSQDAQVQEGKGSASGTEGKVAMLAKPDAATELPGEPVSVTPSCQPADTQEEAGERAARQEEKARRKAEKQAERARRKAENIAAAAAKAERKRARLEQRRKDLEEQRELSRIAQAIAELEAEEAEQDVAVDIPVETPCEPAEVLIEEPVEPEPAEDETKCEAGDYLDFEMARLRRENDQLKRKVASLESDAAFASRMRIPKSALDSLLLAQDAFSSRLTVLDEAKASTKGYKGDVSEVWDVLQAMAYVLHPLVFGEPSGMIDREFQSQCGFELALRDVKEANRNASRVRDRAVEYKGKVRDITPHVKGKNPKKGYSLRVHFFADYEDEVLVVAYCGEHKESFMTSRL